MVPDEGGFLYPQVDVEKCINCHACEKKCPVLNPPVCRNDVPFAYVIQHKDAEVRRFSTSGGAFTAIAQTVIESNGVVFGACIDENFKVYHTFVDSNEDLERFRGSKYVQSDLQDTYNKCKKKLDAGIRVCFSGTPCQVNGLYAFLGKEYDNLLTVDFLCHSVPSPKIFGKYVEYQKKHHPNMKKLFFRDKHYGYDYSTLSLYDEQNTCLYRRGSEFDKWYRFFLTGKCNRRSCYECIYQEKKHLSDITLWDCFFVRDLYKNFDDNKGTTTVVAWNKKGVDAINHLNLNANVVKIEFELIENVLVRKKECYEYSHMLKMYEDCDNLDCDAFFEKYTPTTFRIELLSLVKLFLNRVGLYTSVKRFFR